MKLLDAYRRSVHARANMPAVLALMSGRRINLGLVATDVLPCEHADSAMAGAGFKPVFVRDPVAAPVERLKGAAI